MYTPLARPIHLLKYADEVLDINMAKIRALKLIHRASRLTAVELISLGSYFALAPVHPTRQATHTCAVSPFRFFRPFSSTEKVEEFALRE